MFKLFFATIQLLILAAVCLILVREAMSYHAYYGPDNLLPRSVSDATRRADEMGWFFWETRSTGNKTHSLADNHEREPSKYVRIPVQTTESFEIPRDTPNRNSVVKPPEGNPINEHRPANKHSRLRKTFERIDSAINHLTQE